MNETTELLHFIVQNAQMGKDTIRHLRTLVKDLEFDTFLRGQLRIYNATFDKAAELLEEQQESVEKVGLWDTMSSHVMININTLLDKTPPHIAEMMMQGSVMGIIDLIKKQKEFPHASETAKELAGELLRFEEESMEKLKAYL